MANYDDIVGWFYRNGKRIPIRGKKGEKGYQGKNTKEVLDKVKADRGLEADAADKRYMTENSRAINGDRVDLIGKNKKMSATFNAYFDGSKELINFRREPDKDMLRKNAKQRGATKAPRRSEGKAFGVPRQHSKSFLNESKARRHESYLHSQGAKNVQVTGSKDAFGQTQHRVEWDEPKRKKK